VIRVLLSAPFCLQLWPSSLFTCRPESWDRAPCHTRTKHGDHGAPTSGHGTQPLAGVLARLRRRAFWVDQAQPRCGARCQAGWAQLGRQRLVGERRRAGFSPEARVSRRPRCAARCDGLQQPPPVLGFAAPSSLARLAVTAYPRTTRRLPRRGGTVCLERPRSPFVARHPRSAARTSLCKRGHWISATLGTLSTAMSLRELLD
jgi:hypothetical protein